MNASVVPPAFTFDEDTLALAIRHHQRALAALVETGQFGNLPAPTRLRLISQFRQDLDRMLAQRARRTAPQAALN